MISIIKNILFVSYLKNKGVRRICFLMGLLLGTYFLVEYQYTFRQHFYTLSFQNIDEVRQRYSQDSEILKLVFQKYPADFTGNGIFKDFENWKDAFIRTHTKRYMLVKEVVRRWNDLEERKKLDGKHRDIWQNFSDYVNQPMYISIHDYIQLLYLGLVLFWFYLPFVICITFKWVYSGFKEKA